MQLSYFLEFLKHAVYTFRPLSCHEKAGISEVLKHITKKDVSRVKTLVRRKILKIEMKSMPYSALITDTLKYPSCIVLDDDRKIVVDEFNSKIKESLDEKIQEEFKTNAFNKTISLIAPKIVGFDNIKKAAALQLFSSDPFHMLLLGDPGTGKTDILRAAENLAPISSFGLGSGTSGTGLTTTVLGNEVKKGILSLADGGLALIDELNLMKKEDRAGLYNAMEKGFITYDKGGHHYKFPANCSLLASANPKKDTVIGHDMFAIKKQLPFEPALLSRFHLVFLVRKQDIEQFMEIADEVLTGKHKEVSKADAEFMKKYVEHARKINVRFPEKFNDDIKAFVLKVRLKEKQMLFDVTPRFVIGLKRLIEASARMELRDCVLEKDVKRVIEMYVQALKGVGF